jgi:hypothetical protein
MESIDWTPEICNSGSAFGLGRERVSLWERSCTSFYRRPGSAGAPVKFFLQIGLGLLRTNGEQKVSNGLFRENYRRFCQ